MIVQEHERIVLERMRLGLYAWKVASNASIDATTYSKIERGIRRPNFEQRLGIARALGVEPTVLFPHSHTSCP